MVAHKMRSKGSLTLKELRDALGSDPAVWGTPLPVIISHDDADLFEKLVIAVSKWDSATVAGYSSAQADLRVLAKRCSERLKSN